MKTVAIPLPKDPLLLKLKLSMDNAILRHLSRKYNKDISEVPEIDTTWSIYPMPPDRFVKGSNIIS